jgi:3-oxoacyl-[acyl-carrier-protein] synthase I
MTPLAVMASGMVTALGFNAASTLAALSAGISGVKDTRWVDPESGEWLRGAKVDLPQWSFGVGKLADLVAPAIHECLVSAPHENPDEVPLLIGVSCPARPGRPRGIEESLLEEVEARLGLRRHAESRLFPLDQAGCAAALSVAHKLIGRRDIRRVIVAGVDSYLDQQMLESYVEKRRIMTPTNSNGFFPGEAGTAVLLGAAGSHDADELHLVGIGFAREPATIESTEPFRAEGMTEAVKQALRGAGVALKDVAYRLTDLSGEHYKFKEATFAAGRLNGGDREVPLDLWHPVEYLGEIGAAILPCLLAQAMHASREQYAPGRLVLCHVGSDAGERAALIAQLQRGTIGGE